MLSLNKNKTVPKLLYPSPRVREDMLALKRLTAPENHALTRCLVSDSMTDFYLIGDESGQGFGSGLWYHEGLRYDLSNCSTQS